MGRDPHTLHRSLWLPADVETVFAFFAEAGNLERLTPPLLRFEILTPQPIEMAEGTLIDYRLRIRGLPVRWRTRIAAWDPPHRFVDEQLRGPYRMWVHEHTFEPSDNGTVVRDRVRYRVPGGPLAPLVHRLIVRRDVEAIFDFRERELRRIFEGGKSHAPPDRASPQHV